jgi:hypothetical protein
LIVFGLCAALSLGAAAPARAQDAQALPHSEAQPLDPAAGIAVTADPAPSPTDLCTQEYVAEMNARYGTLVALMLEFERAYPETIEVKCFKRLPQDMARYRTHMDELSASFAAESADIPATVRMLLMETVRKDVSGLCQTDREALAEALKLYGQFITDSRGRHDERMKSAVANMRGLTDERHLSDCTQMMEQKPLQLYGMTFDRDPLLGLAATYAAMQMIDPGLNEKAVRAYRAARAKVTQAP